MSTNIATNTLEHVEQYSDFSMCKKNSFIAKIYVEIKNMYALIRYA